MACARAPATPRRCWRPICRPSACASSSPVWGSVASSTSGVPSRSPELRPHRVEDFVWDIPVGYVEGMRAPGRVFASEELLAKAVDDRAVEQVANVATLPGIVGRAMAMPDIHWGYGFPIGGVAAFDANEGIVSPGGIGFDINCGVRLLRTDLTYDRVRPKLKELIDVLFKLVPTG